MNFSNSVGEYQNLEEREQQVLIKIILIFYQFKNLINQNPNKIREKFEDLTKINYFDQKNEIISSLITEKLIENINTSVIYISPINNFIRSILKNIDFINDSNILNESIIKIIIKKLNQTKGIELIKKLLRILKETENPHLLSKDIIEENSKISNHILSVTQKNDQLGISRRDVTEKVYNNQMMEEKLPKELESLSNETDRILKVIEKIPKTYEHKKIKVASNGHKPYNQYGDFEARA